MILLGMVMMERLWSYRTTGNSSYALDFDGTNDNITLDDYAQNFLGFNKTDDLIFSFYFMTTSTSLV
jgi:hypothetical protein